MVFEERRPEDEFKWKAHPLGYTLDKKDAVMIAKWLDSSIDELFTIFENTRKA